MLSYLKSSRKHGLYYIIGHEKWRNEWIWRLSNINITRIKRVGCLTIFEAAIQKLEFPPIWSYFYSPHLTSLNHEEHQKLSYFGSRLYSNETKVVIPQLEESICSKHQELSVRLESRWSWFLHFYKLSSKPMQSSLLDWDCIECRWEEGGRRLSNFWSQYNYWEICSDDQNLQCIYYIFGNDDYLLSPVSHKLYKILWFINRSFASIKYWEWTGQPGHWGLDKNSRLWSILIRHNLLPA